MTKDKVKIGITGEFLVASKLSQLGYIVSMTMKNTPGVDILVSNGLDAKNIQVKTTNNNKPVWSCTPPKETSKNLIYVFVSLNNGKDPFFHIVPSQKVKDYFEKDDVKHIHFKDADCVYKDKWSNLGL